METKTTVPPIRIALVEDDQKTRKALASLVARYPHICCIGIYPTGEAALREMPPAKPDVALVDINLPGINGIECVCHLKKLMPKLRVLMLTKYQESDLIFNSLRAGASGYLLKKKLTAELISAVEQVYEGGAPMSMQIARKVVDYFNRRKLPAADLEKLTPREQEVLALLANGVLYKEIGEKLGISYHTFRGYQRTIYEKLHIHSRTEAALMYMGRS